MHCTICSCSSGGVDHTNQTYRVRLSRLMRRKEGSRSAQNLDRTVPTSFFDKQVTVEYAKIDRYGRIIGTVLFDGRYICLEQVRAGMPWHYKEFQSEQSSEDRRLYTAAYMLMLRTRRILPNFAMKKIILFSACLLLISVQGFDRRKQPRNCKTCSS